MNNNSSFESRSESQALLNKIVFEFMREQKRKRIWRWVSRSIILAIILWVGWHVLKTQSDAVTARIKPHVGLIDVKGSIFDTQPASADNFAKGLDKAYANSGLKSLIIRIDSPGGSPVQADYMYNALLFYKKKYPAIKVYAVCVDACASAAYYLAAAADEIYANPATLVGSIGVLYNGFGFVDTLQKLGVTRRLQTAGKNKGFLDPFSPEKPGQQQQLQTMLNLIHQQFIDKVKAGRGRRLRINDETFSGLFWTGAQAKEQGLIDGFASSGELVRDVIQLDKLVDYTYEESVLERVAKNIGTSLANQLPTALGMKPGFQ